MVMNGWMNRYQEFHAITGHRLNEVNYQNAAKHRLGRRK
jgi:hypothetical protein